MSNPGLFERIAFWPWAEGGAILCGFAWGAMMGSFINVVAHRLPRGASVVTGRSRCPGCGAAIRPRDNLPVLGWLWLRGRCRDCGWKIPAKYPLVEAGCGILVMLLAAAELAGRGGWPSAAADPHPAGIDRLLGGDLRGLASFGLHAAIVLVVVAWSRLDATGWRPKSAAGLGLLLAAVVGVTAAVPQAGTRLDWEGLPAWLGTGTPANAAAAAVAGIVAGGVVAWVLAILPGPAGRGLGLSWGLPLVGGVVGWQAVTVIGVATAAGARLGRLGSGGNGLLLAGLATAALASGGWPGLLRADFAAGSGGNGFGQAPRPVRWDYAGHQTASQRGFAGF
jgi:leader peptidase (prepilin peptidase)/N-methyltransferase